MCVSVCVRVHFYFSETHLSTVNISFVLNISLHCLFTAWLPLSLWLAGSTWADNWFTPPTFLVLSPSLSLAAMLANITANITAPQHVPWSYFAHYRWLKFCSQVTQGMGDVWSFKL